MTIHKTNEIVRRVADLCTSGISREIARNTLLAQYRFDSLLSTAHSLNAELPAGLGASELVAAIVDAVYKNNLCPKGSAAESELLRKLDMTVYTDGVAIIGTQYGDITIRKASSVGYVAELPGSDGYADSYANGPTPTVAFFNLSDAIRRDEDATEFETVRFEQAA